MAFKFNVLSVLLLKRQQTWLFAFSLKDLREWYWMPYLNDEVIIHLGVMLKK